MRARPESAPKWRGSNASVRLMSATEPAWSPSEVAQGRPLVPAFGEVGLAGDEQVEGGRGRAPVALAHRQLAAGQQGRAGGVGRAAPDAPDLVGDRLGRGRVRCGGELREQRLQARIALVGERGPTRAAEEQRAEERARAAAQLVGRVRRGGTRGGEEIARAISALAWPSARLIAATMAS